MVNNDLMNGHVGKVCHELLQALKHQPGVEDEVFRILIHVSPFIGHLIPVPLESSSLFNEKFISHKHICSAKEAQCVKCILEKLELYYIGKVKECFLCDSKSIRCDPLETDDSLSGGDFEPQLVCSYLEKLQVFIGRKQLEDKFRFIISRHVDILTQQYNLYDQHSIQTATQQFLLLLKAVKVFTKQITYVLSCSKICQSKSRQMFFLQDVLLNQLSIKLLTLARLVKDSFVQTCTKPKADKMDVTSNASSCADDIHLSAEVLSYFSSILKEFLILEDSLDTSDALNILEHGNTKNKKGVLKHQSLELPDLIKTSHHFSSVLSAARGSKWEWCETLQEFAPILSNSMMCNLQKTSRGLLLEAKKSSQKDSVKSLEVVDSVSRGVFKCLIGKPKKIFKFIGVTLKLVLNWLPLATTGKKHRFLSKLHTDFLDAVNQVFKEARQFLVDIVEETPDKNCPSNLPVLLATCTDVVNVLQYCDKKLQQDNRLALNGVIQMYKAVCNHVYQFLLQYHQAQITTVLLHDGESNYWQDPRAFAEGERCSYSIEMWENHLKILREEVMGAVDDEIGHAIISSIFCESLNVLSNRYCSCSPTANRHNQIRQDISRILRFSFLFLWKIIPDAYSICPVQQSSYASERNLVFDKVHTACQDLFTCCHVLASPLTDLYNAILIFADCNAVASSFQWLSVFNPTFFHPDWSGKSSDLSDSAFVFCLLKHLKQNFNKRLYLTVQALTSRRCFLLDKILSSKMLQKHLDFAPVHDLLKLDFVLEAVPCDLLLKSETSLFTNFDFFRIQFDALLLWQKVLYCELLPNMKDALLPALQFMSFYCWSSFSKSLCKKFPPEVVATIPGLFAEDANEIVYICTSLILQGLCSMCLGLSQYIVSFLVKIDEKIHSNPHSFTLKFGSYGSHILLHLASMLLTEPTLLQTADVSLAPSVTSALHEVSRFLLEIDQMPVADSDCDKSLQALHGDISAFKDCTVSLFDRENNCDENDFDFSTLKYLLYEDQLADTDVQIITNASRWICQSYNMIIELLDLDLSYLNKGR